jgi:DNA-binding transcriptional MocR family regulator
MLVVNGSQQALDLIGRAFLRPGDTVLVEDPTYTGALEMFEALSARPVGVSTDEGGIRLEDTERLFARERPKFIYVMPTFQNPTGVSLASGRREALVRLAARYEIPVIEDDFDGELHYDGEAPPPLKSGPDSQGVIYIGTPSKMLFPGLRIGWILAEEPVIERLGRIKQVADLSGSQLLPAAFARFAITGGLERHKEKVRAAYRARRDALLGALERHMPRGCTWSRPAGGMTLLVTLPAPVDFDALLENTAREGVLFTPGPWFYVSGGDRELRLCFGSVAEEAVEPGVIVLAREVRRALERGGRPLPARRKPSLPSV